jgi:VIT1/CCC1 family predicted Fe2+/Mn2+ transporter
MMLEELGLVVDDSNPIINGIITFTAFVLMGFLPLLPYVIGSGGLHQHTQYLLPSLLISAFQLISLGLAKGFLLRLSWKLKLRASLETLVLGTIATAAGYGIGLAFSE